MKNIIKDIYNDMYNKCQEENRIIIKKYEEENGSGNFLINEGSFKVKLGHTYINFFINNSLNEQYSFNISLTYDIYDKKNKINFSINNKENYGNYFYVRYIIKNNKLSLVSDTLFDNKLNEKFDSKIFSNVELISIILNNYKNPEELNDILLLNDFICSDNLLLSKIIESFSKLKEMDKKNESIIKNKL